ncbi:hypothetical protein [Ekhidna sp.]
MSRIILIISFLITSLFHTLAQNTSFEDLKLILAKEAIIVEENENMIQYKVDELQLYLIVDENANRMRLMSPIVEENKLAEEDLKKLLDSNFDRALDAKYATSNGVLWSVYAHPLKELYKDQVIDAFNQVRNLVYNYGTSYSSTTIVFGGGN